MPMEETRTCTRCQHCRESLQLSATEQGELIRNLRVELLCPQCMQLTEVTALSRKKGGQGGSSGTIRSGDVKVRKTPGGSSGQIGKPPFQPIQQTVRTSAPTTCAPGTTSMPFQPMVDAATAPFISGKISRQAWAGVGFRNWLPILAGAALGAAGMFAGLFALAGKKGEPINPTNNQAQNSRP